MLLTIKLFLFALTYGWISGEVAAQSAGYEVGDYATDFNLKNVDGSMVSMADKKDVKGYVIVFTCNYCPYSKLYQDRIINIHNKYAPVGYPVIAINPNDPVQQPEDSFKEMKKRAKEKAYPFPYLIDETQQITSAYGATRTPHIFILNKEENKYKVVYTGAIDDNHKSDQDVKKRYVENALDQLIEGRKVTTTVTKSIGCSIKWK